MILKGHFHFKELRDSFPREPRLPIIGGSLFPDRSPAMPQELSVRAVRDSLMCFNASTAKHSVCLDYPLGPGPTAGPTPWRCCSQAWPSVPAARWASCSTG